MATPDTPPARFHTIAARELALYLDAISYISPPDEMLRLSFALEEIEELKSTVAPRSREAGIRRGRGH